MTSWLLDRATAAGIYIHFFNQITVKKHDVSIATMFNDFLCTFGEVSNKSQTIHASRPTIFYQLLARLRLRRNGGRRARGCAVNANIKAKSSHVITWLAWGPGEQPILLHELRAHLKSRDPNGIYWPGHAGPWRPRGTSAWGRPSTSGEH